MWPPSLTAEPVLRCVRAGHGHAGSLRGWMEAEPGETLEQVDADCAACAFLSDTVVFVVKAETGHRRQH